MAAYRQTNYGIASGTNVTAPSGATADGSTQYNSVSALASQTLQYDNTHTLFGTGDIAVKFASGATAGNVYAGFGSNATYTTRSAASICLYLTAYPTASIRVINLVGNGMLSLSAAGALQVFDSAGAGGGLSFSNAVPLNAWCRLELGVLANSATVGQLEARLFSDPFGVTPLEAHASAASLNTTTSAPTDLRGGMAGSGIANFGPGWLTQLQYSNTALTYPLPPAWSRAPQARPFPPVGALVRSGSF